MSTVIGKLTAERPGDSAGWLNDLVEQLWPNINIAGSAMVKEMVEPMFKTMLPGPLKSMHFTKFDFGPVPIKFSNVTVTRTNADGILMEMDLDWLGKLDAELKASILELGIESVELHGRLTVMLCPITNILPLIGAFQFSFVNPPVLKLHFSGAADFADLGVINRSVVEIVVGLLNPMMTLPNRYLYKLDPNADLFKTYHEPVGVLRITVGKAWGFAQESTSKAKKLFDKLTKAAPDCYVRVTVGAEPLFKTTTKDNQYQPQWDETQEFAVSDLDQCVKFDIRDADLDGDGEVGFAVTTVREMIQGNKQLELSLHVSDKAVGDKVTDGRVSVSCEYFGIETSNCDFSIQQHSGPNHISGIATVLIAGAFGIPGARNALKPSVVFSWGDKHHYQTAIITDAPGTDINNPVFDTTFRVLATSDLTDGSKYFRFALLNDKTELGSTDVSFDEVHKAENMTLARAFDVGNGATIRAMICLRGVGVPTMPQQSDLPMRSV